MDKNLLKNLEKFHLPDLEALVPEAEDYLKKYEKAIQKSVVQAHLFLRCFLYQIQFLY